MEHTLSVDLYELTMGQSYFIYKRDTSATFDLFVRQLPPNRSYLVAAGLEDILGYLQHLRFSTDDIGYLRKLKFFSADYLEYLSNFRFTGDVWALPEGEVFFAQEPILRVSAPIIEAQLIESYLLSTVNLQTMIASKASRIVAAACGRPVFDFSLRRTHGPDAAVKVARSSYIAGCSGTSDVLAGKMYGIPVAGTMAHSFVMSFKNELDSFLAYASTFPDKTILLVDTYACLKGIENAIAIGQYLKERGYLLLGIRLDSGDTVRLSKLARAMLDRAGLGFVKIFASGNLDEFKIRGLIKRGARVDSFGVGTNMGTSSDAPSLDVIYKISGVTDEAGNYLPTMKLSKGKATFPGRKQVFRIRDRRDRFMKDIIAIEGERIGARPLLKKVVDSGRLVYQAPSLEKIRRYHLLTLSRFSADMQDIARRYTYPVMVSPKLKQLRARLSRQCAKRQ